MTRSFVRHLPGERTCDVCGQTGCDPLWQHTITAFFYCDDCKRAFPPDDLVRVV